MFHLVQCRNLRSELNSSFNSINFLKFSALLLRYYDLGETELETGISTSLMLIASGSVGIVNMLCGMLSPIALLLKAV
jgi:hypothetical protein